MFEVTLSFDNGPEPGVTEQVLEILRARAVKTTFFVIGEKMADPERRDLARRAHGEGHWIGNHTYTHGAPLGDGADMDRVLSEIGSTEALIGDLARPERLFRPNGDGGILSERLFSPTAAQYLAKNCYTCVLWDAIPHDWDDPEGWADRGLAIVRDRPTSLVVLHDLPTGAMRHLDRFLGMIRDAGGHIRQEFPEGCIVMRNGQPSARMAAYTRGTA